jgi:hypothetical protein
VALGILCKANFDGSRHWAKDLDKVMQEYGLYNLKCSHESNIFLSPLLPHNYLSMYISCQKQLMLYDAIPPFYAILLHNSYVILLLSGLEEKFLASKFFLLLVTGSSLEILSYHLPVRRGAAKMLGSRCKAKEPLDAETNAAISTPLPPQLPNQMTELAK